MTVYSRPDLLTRRSAVIRASQVKRRPAPEVLAKFPNPAPYAMHKGPLIVHIDRDTEVEMAFVDPLSTHVTTGLIDVQYQPLAWCVELASWHEYLLTYHGHEEFADAVVARVRDDLIDLVQPAKIEVSGQFAVGGGHTVRASALWDRRMVAMADAAGAISEVH